MNELSDLHEFFAASTGAAAALIGLLFVAISIAPDKIFGPNAGAAQRTNAERAFTALGNVFFVSMAGLIPHQGIDAIAVIAAIAMVQVVLTALAMNKRYPGYLSWRNAGLISLCAYGFELVSALRIHSGDPSGVKIVWVVLGLYSYALGISWVLMGAKEPPAKST